MIDFQNNKNCCGCSACVAACTQKCIEMQRDKEGFYRPFLINADNCINCGLCSKVCPVLNQKEQVKKVDRGYIVQHNDESVRMESTSGGAFSAIASSVIHDSGIVYGAAYDANLQVIHIGVEKESDLVKFRNSKYIQSNLLNTFREVKEHLERGKFVCYSGTPCQIEGLLSFLRKDYSNLITVDVVCHGISSPLIWDKYLEIQTKEYSPDNIRFRHKHYGYKYSTMSLMKENHEIYYGGVESDYMLRAYFSNNCDQKMCYECPFKKRYRNSDITIWDCFQPSYFNKSFDDDKGTTSVLVNSQKGVDRFKKVQNDGNLRIFEVDADELTFGNREMVGSVACGSVRDDFLADASMMDGQSLFSKYFPQGSTTKIKRNIRICLLKLGIYKKIKYLLFLKRRKQCK